MSGPSNRSQLVVDRKAPLRKHMERYKNSKTSEKILGGSFVLSAKEQGENLIQWCDSRNVYELLDNPAAPILPVKHKTPLDERILDLFANLEEVIP